MPAPRIPGIASALLMAVCTSLASPVRVEITGTPGDWGLLRDGKPFQVRGGGGDGDYRLFAQIGGNTIRTYSSTNVSGQMQRAREAGIAVLFGLWIGHERHGFDYSDPSAIERQRRMVVDSVTAWRSNPDILMWAVGNEMEGDGRNPAVWREVNHLARLVRELDDRPVLTILAGAAPHKLDAVREYCPDLHLVGINAYGGLGGVHERMVRHLPDLPYMITEFGALGHWESPKTPWGVEIEETSDAKGARILEGWTRHIAGNAGRCLGGFVFRWGWKQEATHTWFALLLDDGTPAAPIDHLQKAWTGNWPDRRAPQIEPLASEQLRSAVRPGMRIPLSARSASRSDGPLTHHWEVYQESRDRRSGGDREERPAPVSGAIVQREPGSPDAVLVAPGPGRYRVFLTVSSPGTRAATANLPFLVE